MKQPVERRLAAILAADVAGYSRLMGVDEEGTHASLLRAEDQGIGAPDCRLILGGLSHTNVLSRLPQHRRKMPPARWLRAVPAPATSAAAAWACVHKNPPNPNNRQREGSSGLLRSRLHPTLRHRSGGAGQSPRDVAS